MNDGKDLRAKPKKRQCQNLKQEVDRVHAKWIWFAYQQAHEKHTFTTEEPVLQHVFSSCVRNERD